ncbi:MAG: flagellar hook-associated family protein [Rhodomicrobium sp.]|jgi:flagellar hook-associated protein 3 FlgL
MMQVSTATLFAIPRNAVGDLQTQLSKAETELSTGQVADPVGDLGSQAGLFQSLQAQTTTLNNIETTNTIAQSNMTAAENALTSITSDAQNFINTLITAQSTGSVATLQSQAQTLLGSLTNTLNTTSGGVYVFGGVNDSVQPVVDYSQGPQAATAAAFQTAFGFSQTSSQVGQITATAMQGFLTGPFANLFSGTNWTTNWSQASSMPTSVFISPSQEVTTSVTANDPAFGELASAYASISDLNIAGLGASTQQAVITNALNVASAAMSGIGDMQTTLGLSQSQITNANSQLQSQASFLNTWAARLGNVDPAQAATQLSNLTTELETAYSLTDRISKLGLVNYLSA